MSKGTGVLTSMEKGLLTSKVTDLVTQMLVDFWMAEEIARRKGYETAGEMPTKKLTDVVT